MQPMNDRGWIKYHRKFDENPLFNMEPKCKAFAWIDLVSLANFEDGKIYVRGIEVTIKRGQVGWSEPRLASRWNWSRTKVRTFLEKLEKEQQIRQEKDNVTTLITILNYDYYQDKPSREKQQTEQQKEHQTRQQTGQQKDTKKNVKNIYIESDELNLKKVRDSICSYYNFNEQLHFRNFALATSFVKHLSNTGRLEDFIAQFDAYKKLKTSMAFAHSFMRFIGTPERDYDDAAWLNDNYVARLKSRESEKNSTNRNAGDAPRQTSKPPKQYA
jgi:hypothetical protein